MRSDGEGRRIEEIRIEKRKGRRIEKRKGNQNREKEGKQGTNKEQRGTSSS